MKKRPYPHRKEALALVAFLVVAALALGLCSQLLRPLRTAYGSTWSTYLQEPEDSIDVLYLGSSYAYCDWNPAEIYAASGLTGYVMGGSEQTPAITYWYLKEALKTQSPQLVVLEGSSLFFQRYQNYTQINLGYMPWGMNRVHAILEAAEEDKKLGLFLDLYFYHDRWKELTPASVKAALTPAKADPLKGHTAVDKVYVPENDPWIRNMDAVDWDLYAQNMADFARIAQLCQEEGISLLVTINPTYSQFSQDVYAKLEEDVTAAGDHVRFVCWADSFEDLGLDRTTCLYDGGHLNQQGAAVFSRKMGEYLATLGYVPRLQTPENQTAWAAAVDYWDQYLSLSGS